MKSTEEIFNAVKKRLNVNYSQNTDNGFKFSYYYGIKNWSHQVQLITENESIFLITRRALKIKDFEKYLFQNFNEREANYKIPIQNERQAIGILIMHDDFKLK